jgi:hypothetical protein
MGINDLFDNIASIFNQFADEIMAERSPENIPITGRGPDSEGKNTENFAARENQIEVDFPKRE